MQTTICKDERLDPAMSVKCLPVLLVDEMEVEKKQHKKPPITLKLPMVGHLLDPSMNRRFK